MTLNRGEPQGWREGWAAVGFATAAVEASFWRDDPGVPRCPTLKCETVLPSGGPQALLGCPAPLRC